MAFLFKDKFEPAKLTLQLQLSTKRLTLAKQKSTQLSLNLKREVADLLRQAKEEKARLRAIAVIHEDYKTEVLAQILVYVNTILARTDLLLSMTACPADLREQVCGIVFAAPFLEEQEELIEARKQLMLRYGKKFPDECVSCNAINAKLKTRLSPSPPEASIVNFYVNSIAEQNKIPGFCSLEQPALGPLPADPRRCVAYGPGLEDGETTKPSVFVIEARDSTGARCANGGQDFKVFISGPNGLQIVGDVQDRGDGSHLAQFVPPESGAYAIAIYLGDIPIGNGEPWQVFVRETELPTDPRYCRCSGDGLANGWTNEVSHFTIESIDSAGKQRGKGGDDFKVFVSGPNGAQIYGEVKDNGDGTYFASYTPPFAGGYAIAVYCGQTPVGDGQPFLATIQDRPTETVSSDQDLMARFANIMATKVTPAPRKSGLNAAELSMSIVLDSGTGVIKAGLAGDPAPLTTFPSVVGRPLFTSAVPMDGSKNEIYIGNEARKMKGVLTLKYPVNRGVVGDWTDMESLWEHTFLNELRLDVRNHPVLLTEPAFNPKRNREKAVELMFEKFEVPGLFLASQAVLALRSYGLKTGLVLEAGDGVCSTVPVVNGEAIKYSTNRLELGGRDVTNYLVKLLSEDGVFLNSTSSERDIAREIKETIGYVALDFAAEREKPQLDVVQSFKMPDEQVIQAAHSRFVCAEPLFTPAQIGKDTAGITQMIMDSIRDSKAKDQAGLAANIVLSGGTTMFTGFLDRLHKELSTSMAGFPFNVRASDSRKLAVWLGGAAMSSQHEAFCDLCISKAEYQEKGLACLDLLPASLTL